MIHHELLIVGGGASGLLAAIYAKDLGIDVAILEAGDRVGRKILTTGNGRCNISNSTITSPFKGFHSSNEKFPITTLENFSVNDTIDFFSFLGLPIVELENGKLYPKSLQASSVVDVLRLALEDRSIPVYNSCKVKSIHKNKKFILSTSNEEFDSFSCGKLILACGGKSAEKTGSDGSGYSLSRDLGHKVITPLPGIVQLKLDYPYLKALSGIKFDGLASISIDGKVHRKELGELLFTDYGISGPPILQLSALASRAIYEGKSVDILIDMNPEASHTDVDNFLQGHLSIFSHRKISDALIGIVNKKLIPTLLKEASVDNFHKPAWELSWQEKSKLISLMKEWKFKCIGTNGFNNAQVTIGGVDTRDVNEESLESKLVSGLYFIGEILDVHGDCGGYNLQWAWSSSHKAINSILKANNPEA
ncbi:NAD(P)/FAD-dependent oxidoreductase [Clostridium sp. 'White wine YQ']|uniref:NAD(P)/FAD-dependent oxidoreductase n=1 Tax=Clostridium sp. 'White wine YQ' TaxID=3027474 RepID=UPI0023659E7E|nr:NAD(P)/FAD-dependent oxidoreductase [Clostridium sp. 'White wine YQ']MDD7796261.1 NAD(P)/FAD-dependent oxidoreductase [Clostridium sp. 'White wine YQ']